MTAHQPDIMEFGAVQVVTPSGRHELTRRQWSDVQAAMILADVRPEAAAFIVGDLEERMGVHPAHRRALQRGADQVKAEIRKANASRRRAEIDRVRQLQAPWKPPPLDKRRLEKASRKLASSDPRQIQQGRAELLSIEESRQARADEMRIAAEQTEALQLADTRGEEYEISARSEHRGRIRFLDRDGLERLFVGHSISPIQYAAGMRYRDLYERTDPERALKPMDYAGVYGLSHGGEGYAEKRSGWVRSLLSLEARIRNEDKNGHAVRALQEVAGNRRAISTFASGGRARERYRDALLLALDICADFFGLQ